MSGDSRATSSPATALPSNPSSAASSSDATTIAASNQPRRRFVPEPIETSTKSSRRSRSDVAVQESAGTDPSDNQDVTIKELASKPDVEMTSPSPSAAPRRFAPQPVETTSKSSRRPMPQPEETTTKSTRKFLPQPEETSTKSVKRRFVPEPIATSSRSRRNSKEQAETPRATRRFVPDPIESVKASNRRFGSPRTSAQASRVQSKSEAPRKFSPALIESASRSVRKGDVHPELTVLDRTEPSAAYFTLRRRRAVPTDGSSVASTPHLHESRFSAANILARQEGHDARRPDSAHSFHVPDLPSIESSHSGRSSESEDDAASSSSTTSHLSQAYRQKARARESCDDRFSGYLLALAARAAEKQLRDQALAAFPNENNYQHIDHFAGDNEDGSDSDDLFSPDLKLEFEKIRRESAADLGREFAEMRKFKEQAEINRQLEESEKDYTPTKEPESRFSAAALAAKYRALAMDASDLDKETPLSKWKKEKEKEKEEAKKKVSPPMLGTDIVFPMSLSPQGTRCETDQTTSHRHGTGSQSVGSMTGLWHADESSDDSEGDGLWHGSCKKGSSHLSASPVLNRAMLMTPAVEMEDPFSRMLGMSLKDLPENGNQSGTQTPTRSSGGSLRPPHPPSRMITESELDAAFTPPDSFKASTIKLQLPPTSKKNKSSKHVEDREAKIAGEFDDAFVTQIYNYLSLGYPCLAHKFDDELSRISKIPISELRKDDERVDAKGHVDAPETGRQNGNGSNATTTQAEVSAGACARWSALKIYVHEWARQQPKLDGPSEEPDAWGAPGRRGSWAI